MVPLPLPLLAGGPSRMFLRTTTSLRKDAARRPKRDRHRSATAPEAVRALGGILPEVSDSLGLFHVPEISQEDCSTRDRLLALQTVLGA
jgi:hypothetical protein